MVLNQYKEIEKSFLRQQTEMRERERARAGSSGGGRDGAEVMTAFSEVGKKTTEQTKHEIAMSTKNLLASKVVVYDFLHYPCPVLGPLVSFSSGSFTDLVNMACYNLGVVNCCTRRTRLTFKKILNNPAMGIPVW